MKKKRRREIMTIEEKVNFLNQSVKELSFYRNKKKKYYKLKSYQLPDNNIYKEVWEFVETLNDIPYLIDLVKLDKIERR